MIRKVAAVSSLFATLVLAPFTADAVAVAQIDTFEDGTTMGWGAGSFHPFPPAVVPSGGPAGVDDGFLLLTAIGGDGPGSRLSAMNASQWAGDYLGAGVTSLRMDVNNFGPDEVYLRLLFEDLDGGVPAHRALTAAAIVPPGSGWTTVVFDVLISDLVEQLGDAASALTNADQLRIFHNAAAAFSDPAVGPPAMTVQLGVDNIRAIASVPEPSTGVLVASSLAALCAIVHRRMRAAG